MVVPRAAQPAAPWNHNIAYFPLIERVGRARPRRNAIDVGSGDGMLAYRLSSFIPSVVGLDSDAEQALGAASRYPKTGLRFEVGDVLATRLPDEPFDLVACSAAIHHMDLSAALVRFRELIAPGGTLVVVGLAIESGPIDWALSVFSVPINRFVRARRGWFEHGAPTKDSALTYREIQRVAEDLLPGARFRRMLFWRYSLVWNRPNPNRD